MSKERHWNATASISVAGIDADRFQLDTAAAVTIGRSPRCGLASPSPRIEVPRELARLRATRSGWVLENEGTTVGRRPKPVRVTGPDITSPGGAAFAPHAWVLLGPGAWTLEWDVGVRVVVRLQPHETGADAALPIARDEPRQPSGMATIAPEPIQLNEAQRRNMAALFAYRLRGDAPPKDPFAEAARLIDTNPATHAAIRNRVKSQYNKLRHRIARIRGGDEFDGLDEVGRYLIDLTGTIGQDDIED